MSLIRVEPGPGENGSFFTLSINIVRRRLVALTQRLAIAISGAAAATAGILPSTVPIAVKITLLIIGSVGLGLSARPSS
jgi:Ethanolamine utilization protein EutJ (predicted chaperonin)